MKQQEKNIFWVDAVKAICMIFVFFAHAEIYAGYTIISINNIFRPFYVNAFFFVSGYLLFRKQWSERMLSVTARDWLGPNGGGQILVKNILFKLAIPSILFAFINFFPKKIIRGEAIIMNDLLADTLGGCSLWFTCSLVLVELFIFVMLLSRSNKACVYLLVSILIAFLGLFLVNNDVSILGMSDFPWFYKRAMIALLYVVCGGFYYKYETILCHFVSKWYSMIFLVLFYITIEFCMPEKALCLTSVGQMNVLGVMVSIVGTVLLIEFCRRLKKYKILTFIGRNSIVFYFFSGALPVTLCAVLSKVMAIQNIVGAFIVFAISLFMGGVVAYIVSRWLPWLIDVRKVSNRFSLCQIK